MLRVIGGNLPSATWTYGAEQDVSDTEWSYSNVPLGDAKSGRVIVVALGARSLQANSDFASVTIGGTNMAQQVKSSPLLNAELWSLAYPTGSTADVVVQTGGDAALGFHMSVWALYNLRNGATALDTDSDNQGFPTANATLDLPSSGILIACGNENASMDEGVTWSGVTQDYISSDDLFTGVSVQGQGADSTYDISATSDVGVVSVAAGVWR